LGTNSCSQAALGHFSFLLVTLIFEIHKQTIDNKIMFVYADNAIMQGRTKLMEEDRAERFKLLTRDGNELDSVFVDKRKK
jgi:hypothetical protein